MKHAPIIEAIGHGFKDIFQHLLGNPLVVLRHMMMVLLVIPGVFLMLFVFALNESSVKAYLQNERKAYSTFDFSANSSSIPLCAPSAGEANYADYPDCVSTSIQPIDEVAASSISKIGRALQMMWIMSFVGYMGWHAKYLFPTHDEAGNLRAMTKLPLTPLLQPIIDVIERNEGTVADMHIDAPGILMAFRASLDVGHALSAVCDDELANRADYHWNVSGSYMEDVARDSMVWRLTANDVRLDYRSDRFSLDETVLRAQLKRIARLLEQKLATNSAVMRASQTASLV
jgi:hypothetical protein